MQGARPHPRGLSVPTPSPELASAGRAGCTDHHKARQHTCRVARGPDVHRACRCRSCVVSVWRRNTDSRCEHHRQIRRVRTLPGTTGRPDVLARGVTTKQNGSETGSFSTLKAIDVTACMAAGWQWREGYADCCGVVEPCCREDGWHAGIVAVQLCVHACMHEALWHTHGSVACVPLDRRRIECGACLCQCSILVAAIPWDRDSEGYGVTLEGRLETTLFT